MDFEDGSFCGASHELVKLLFMLVTAKFNSTIQLIALNVYVFCMLAFHLLSKVSGKACIRHFFLEIAVGLMDCADISLPYRKDVGKEYDQKIKLDISQVAKSESLDS